MRDHDRVGIIGVMMQGLRELRAGIASVLEHAHHLSVTRARPRGLPRCGPAFCGSLGAHGLASSGGACCRAAAFCGDMALLSERTMRCGAPRLVLERTGRGTTARTRRCPRL